MFLDPRFLANVTMIAAPTVMFLAVSALLLMMTGPGSAQPPGNRQVEIRGGESVEVPGANGRSITLRFTEAELEAFTGSGSGEYSQFKNCVEQAVKGYLEGISENSGTTFTIV